MIQYKGYLAKIEFDDETESFHGEVVNTRDVITFQGQSVRELKQALKDSVDDYIAFCKERGEVPEKPYSGQFLTRVSPELHRQIHLAAGRAGTSVNAWIAQQLELAVGAGPGRRKAAPRKAKAVSTDRDQPVPPRKQRTARK